MPNERPLLLQPFFIVSIAIIIVRPSLLTMTTLNKMRKVLLILCSMMADETNLGLNCLFKIEQQRSEEESSVGDALALAFR